MPICRLTAININVTMDSNAVLNCNLSKHNSYSHLNVFHKINYLDTQKICQTGNLVGAGK
jgi:hypothetical protein